MELTCLVGLVGAWDMEACISFIVFTEPYSPSCLGICFPVVDAQPVGVYFDWAVFKGLCSGGPQCHFGGGGWDSSMNTLKQSLRVVSIRNGLRVWIVSSRVGFVKNSGGCECVGFHLSFMELRSFCTCSMHLFGCLQV